MQKRATQLGVALSNYKKRVIVIHEGYRKHLTLLSGLKMKIKINLFKLLERRLCHEQ